MGENSKYYKLGEKLGKSIGKNASAGTFVLIGIMCIFIALVAMLIAFAIEALVLWGLGSLILWLIGIEATITFGQCFGFVILIDILASMIKKLFGRKNVININKD